MSKKIQKNTDSKDYNDLLQDLLQDINNYKEKLTTTAKNKQQDKKHNIPESIKNATKDFERFLSKDLQNSSTEEEINNQASNNVDDFLLYLKNMKQGLFTIDKQTKDTTQDTTKDAHQNINQDTNTLTIKGKVYYNTMNYQNYEENIIITLSGKGDKELITLETDTQTIYKYLNDNRKIIIKYKEQKPIITNINDSAISLYNEIIDHIKQKYETQDIQQPIQTTDALLSSKLTDLFGKIAYRINGNRSFRYAYESSRTNGIIKLISRYVLANLVNNYDYNNNIIEERAIGNIYEKLDIIIPNIVTRIILELIIEEELYSGINYEMYKSKWCEGYPIVTDIFIETISAIVDLVIKDFKRNNEYMEEVIEQNHKNINIKAKTVIESISKIKFDISDNILTLSIDELNNYVNIDLFSYNDSYLHSKEDLKKAIKRSIELNIPENISSPETKQVTQAVIDSLKTIEEFNKTEDLQYTEECITKNSIEDEIAMKGAQIVGYLNRQRLINLLYLQYYLQDQQQQQEEQDKQQTQDIQSNNNIQDNNYKDTCNEIYSKYLEVNVLNKVKNKSESKIVKNDTKIVTKRIPAVAMSTNTSLLYGDSILGNFLFTSKKNKNSEAQICVNNLYSDDIDILFRIDVAKKLYKVIITVYINPIKNSWIICGTGEYGKLDEDTIKNINDLVDVLKVWRFNSKYDKNIEIRLKKTIKSLSTHISKELTDDKIKELEKSI